VRARRHGNGDQHLRRTADRLRGGPDLASGVGGDAARGRPERVDLKGEDIRPPRAAVERFPPAGFCGLLSDELINIEDVRQEDVRDDHERDQTEGNDHTSESVTGPDCRPYDHRRGQADRKPDCRILHVAKHEVTLAPGTALIQPPPRSP